MTAQAGYWRCAEPWTDSIPSQLEYLGHADILRQHAWIHESQYLATDRSPRALARLLRECEQQTRRRPVLCLDSNPYFSRDLTDDLAREIDPEHYVILTGNVWDIWSDRENVAYWPTFLISQQRLPNHQGQSRQGRISFLSRMARPHRLELWARIQHLVRPDDWVQINAITESLTDPDPRVTLLPWTNQPHSPGELEPWHGNLHHNQHPAYACCVNITAETDIRSGMVMLTEKTWKAYRSGCMVINYGSAGTVSLLERLGLWIWSEHDLDLGAEHKIPYIQDLFQRDDIPAQYEHYHREISHNRRLVESRDFALDLASSALTKLA